MFLSIKKTIFISLLMIGYVCSDSFAQAYSLKIYETEINLDSVDLKGYKTLFTQSHEEVKKAWWKYIKRKAILENHLTHYELKIPDLERNANEPLYLISQLTGDETTNYRTITLALRTHNLEETQIESIDGEVKQMLLNFKTDYFVNSIEEKIEDQEKLSRKLSAQLEKLKTSKKREQMDSTALAAKEKEILIGLKQIDQNLEGLKAQLLEIK